MSEVLFKNPYRGRKVAKQESYQSEHERLGAQPIEYPVDKTEAHSFVEKNSPKPPRQTIVQSGNNEDIMWTKALEEPAAPQPPIVVPHPQPPIRTDFRKSSL